MPSRDELIKYEDGTYARSARCTRIGPKDRLWGNQRMRGRRAIVTAMAVLFATTSCACIVAGHEDGEPMIITKPDVSGETIPCAVFFADNMVYAPQWRIGNLVRVETMIIDMTGFASAEDIPESALNVPEEILADLPIPPEVIEAGTQQQWALLNYPDLLEETKMVSVNYIEVRVSGPGCDETYSAEWDPMTGDLISEEGPLGREVNKGGHLIYGMLWDSSLYLDETDEGMYTVEVRLGDWYTVDFAIAHLYNPEVEGEYLNEGFPFGSLLLEGDPDFTVYGIGVGGVSLDDPDNPESGYAWIDLRLIPEGSGGGNGGDSGNQGEGGNGNGHCGAKSGGNGGDRYRRK